MAGENVKAVTISAGTVALKDLPVPKIASDELLVHMRVCGVCGTDMEKIRGEQITPPILGHEVAGEIEQVGEQVQDFRRGDRVSVHHHVSCGNCFYCKNGLETLCDSYPKSNLDPCGFAEYFRVPSTLVNGGAVHRLPESMTYIEGSQAEPTACCIRALQKAGVKAGSTIAIFGVGPVGLAHVQLAKAYGVSRVIAIDILENRRQMAVRVGADLTIDPASENVTEIVASATQGLGTDYAIVATGNMKALEQAFSAVRKGGQVMLFGAPPRGTQLSLDVSRLFLREIMFQSSYSTSETEMRMALNFIEKKRINPSAIVTHTLPLTRTLEAFSLAEKGESVKVVVENG